MLLDLLGNRPQAELSCSQLLTQAIEFCPRGLQARFVVEAKFFIDLREMSRWAHGEFLTFGVQFFDLARQSLKLRGVGRALLKRRFQRRQSFDLLRQRHFHRLRFFWGEHEVLQHLKSLLDGVFSLRHSLRPYGPFHILGRCSGDRCLFNWCDGLGWRWSLGWRQTHPEEQTQDHHGHSKAAMWVHSLSLFASNGLCTCLAWITTPMICTPSPAGEGGAACVPAYHIQRGVASSPCCVDVVKRARCW